ncbi:hypothetical protein J1N35_006436 [Gossypium stocksii]|uniref:Reverse transcriptase domain-containing protein n=1 Tax=Gossypium stocksii TaxID=47602 RepID=A0A9D4AKA6_9ROSI|nr:hypothetical protein J1N35_006436 [Gossypium stocksii]
MLESGSEMSRGSVCISEIELPGRVSNGQNFKASNSKGGWKLNKTRKGPSTRFKNSDNSRVHFADSMKKVAERIVSEFDGISANKLSRKTGGQEEPRCASDKFLRVFREYNNLYKPDIISLLEPRISGFKADTIIANWKSSVDLEVVVNHSQFILVRIYSKLHFYPIFVAFVYGSPDKLKRKFLWNDLSHTVPREYVPWMAIGDFNVFLSPEDKKGGHVKGRRCISFGEFMDNAFLHDLGFQSPLFTWHQGALFERLDRAVGNEAWVEAFPYCHITHLPKIKSDHRPLLMKFCCDGSKSLFQQEILVRNELEDVLHHEEILWKQKFRCEWLNLGDRNTSYFHRRSIMRRKFNKITALRNADEEWIFDSEAFKTETVKFFQNHYGESPGPSRPLPPSAFPRLSYEDVDFLGKGVTNEEIKSALFDMAPLKAPGSDGFQAAFFQIQWDNIVGVLIPKVPNPGDFSQFRPISLCSVLYKLVMKIIANRFKSIFSKIIGQEQAGFIAGRSIVDNVIIAQEVLHSMRAKKQSQWMAIKIDLEKAYNRVLWNGVPTQKFRPVRGTRQGCPLSPYLFVLCMECRADLTHCGLLKTFLSNFCELSGHKGAAEGKRKLTLVGWNNICQPKLHGGFGLRRLEDQNKAFMMKICYSLITKSEALWVQYVLGHGDISPQSKVNEMVLDNREWNFDLFRLWLPNDLVNRIINILSPFESVKPDTLSWSRTTSGVFSVKSAYSLLKKESWNPKDEN